MTTVASSSNAAGVPAADGTSFDHEPDNANSQFDAIWDEAESRAAATAPDNVANAEKPSGSDCVPCGGDGSPAGGDGETATPEESLRRTHLRAWSSLTGVMGPDP